MQVHPHLAVPPGQEQRVWARTKQRVWARTALSLVSWSALGCAELSCNWPGCPTQVNSYPCAAFFHAAQDILTAATKAEALKASGG